MARIEEYRTHIENLIRQYRNYKPSYGDIKVQLVFDRENEHCQLLNVG